MVWHSFLLATEQYEDFQPRVCGLVPSTSRPRFRRRTSNNEEPARWHNEPGPAPSARDVGRAAVSPDRAEAAAREFHTQGFVALRSVLSAGQAQASSWISSERRYRDPQASTTPRTGTWSAAA